MADEVRSGRRRSAYVTRQRVEICCALLVVLFIVFTTLFEIIYRRQNVCLNVDSVNLEDIEKVNLTGLTRHQNGSYVNSGGLDFTPGSYQESEDGTVFGFPCKIRTCVTKCCRENYSLVWNELEGASCVKTNITLFEDYFKNVDFVKVKDESCPQPTKQNISRSELYVIIKNLYLSNKNETYDLLGSHNVYLTDYGGIVSNTKDGPNAVKYWNQSVYCVELFDQDDQVSIFKVRNKDETEDSFYLRDLAAIISIPFTLATAVVYLFLPELRTLHGKSLISHVTSLTLAYLALAAAYTDIVTIQDTRLCKVVGFSIEFGLLGSFFWLNVVSYDLWCAFSHIKTPKRLQNNAKFIVYSCYGWGAPLIITVLSIIVDSIPSAPRKIKPYVGTSSCWFEGNDSQSIFFYLPTGVLMSLNVMMFGTTLWRLWDNYKDSRKAFPKDSQRNGQPLSKADHRSKGDIGVEFMAYNKKDYIYLTWSACENTLHTFSDPVIIYPKL